MKGSVLLFPEAWLTWRPSLANVCPELKILFAGKRNRNFHADFYPKTSILKLFTPTSILKLKILFQISSDEKVLFGAKGFGQSFGFFFFLYFPPVGLLQWPSFPSLSNRSPGSFCLTFVLTALAVRSWGLLVQTQRVGELIFAFPLSVAYHVTQDVKFTDVTCKTHSG